MMITRPIRLATQTTQRYIGSLVSAAVFLLALTAASTQAQVASSAQIEQWRQQMRRALFIPDPLPAVVPESYGSFSPIPAVVAERVSYRTEFGLRIPAIVYRPAKAPKGKMPAIVIVNGHGGDKSSWYAYYTGVLYAQAGAVVLTYDPIGEGERNDDHKVNAGEHDRLILDPSSMPPRMGGLMVTDVMQAVSYLGQRADVDPRRIAVMGFSMGSFISSLAGAADPRIHALLLVGGGDLDGPGGYWDSSHAVMCQSGPYKALAFMGDRPAVLFTLNARRGSTFIINGTNDTVVDIPHHEQDFFDALRQRVIAKNGSDRGVFTTFFDPGASHRPSWMTRSAAEWLDRQLDFPNWPQSSIATLPVTSIRDWGTAVGYTFNKSSEREDRDAGIRAIAANVPLLTSTQTDILSRSAWDLLKGDLIYSSWVERATQAARSAPANAEVAPSSHANGSYD
jgi:dienelactone hydrolase